MVPGGTRGTQNRTGVSFNRGPELSLTRPRLRRPKHGPAALSPCPRRHPVRAAPGRPRSSLFRSRGTTSSGRPVFRTRIAACCLRRPLPFQVRKGTSRPLPFKKKSFSTREYTPLAFRNHKGSHPPPFFEIARGYASFSAQRKPHPAHGVPAHPRGAWRGVGGEVRRSARHPSGGRPTSGSPLCACVCACGRTWACVRMCACARVRACW